MNLQGLCPPVVVISIYEVEFTTASDKKVVLVVTTTTVIMMVVVVVMVMQMIASKVDLMCNGLQTIVYHILFCMFLKAKVRQH
jgi:hypothetical protein